MRYQIFAGKTYYPRGGSGALIESHEEEARAVDRGKLLASIPHRIVTLDHFEEEQTEEIEWVQVFDSLAGVTVYEYGRPLGGTDPIVRVEEIVL